MPPLSTSDYYPGSKVVVEIDNIILWGYVMGATDYFKEVALARGDYARAADGMLLHVQVSGVLLTEDYEYACAENLFRLHIVSESEVIPIAD